MTIVLSSNLTRGQEVKLHRVLSFATGTEVPANEAPAIAYSPNGKFIAASWFGGVCIFHASSGRPFAMLPHDNAMNPIAYSPDGKVIFGEDTSTYTLGKIIGHPVSFWRISNQKLVKTIQLPSEKHHNTFFAMHPKGDMYACGMGNELSLYEFKSEKLICKYQLNDDQKEVSGFAFHPNGESLAVSTNTGVQFLEITSMRLISNFINKKLNLSARFQYSANGKLVASLDWHQTLAIGTAAGQNSKVNFVHDAEIDVDFWAMSLSPNGKLVALGGGVDSNPNNPNAVPSKPYLVLLDTETGETVAELHDMVPDIVFELAFSPDGKQLAVACDEELAIRILDTSQFVKKQSNSGKKKADPKKSESESEFQKKASRTWSSANGKFKVIAVLVSQTKTTVKLKKAEGELISVPKEKLSQSDLDYLNGK